MKWPVDLSHIDKELQVLYSRLIEKKSILTKNRPIPGIAIKKIAEQLAIEWTYNSNSIEGNTLTLRETQLVLQEGITIKGVSLGAESERFQRIGKNILRPIVTGIDGLLADQGLGEADGVVQGIGHGGGLARPVLTGKQRGSGSRHYRIAILFCLPGSNLDR